jgi:GTPase SAR1 family protein
MSQRDITAKLLIIGNSGVGKTNILLKFTANTFVMSHITTIGIFSFRQESILNPKQFSLIAKRSNFKSGTLLANSASKPSPKRIIKEPKVSFWLMLSMTRLPLIRYNLGLSKSGKMPLKTS